MSSSNPIPPNTTFVQADPSTFRAVVQRLTGAPDHQIHQPVQKFPFPAPPTTREEPKGPTLNLHERRRTTKHLLQLDLQAGTTTTPPTCSTGQFVMMSPVSTLELLALGSPATPVSSCPSVDEETAMADNIGFYLYPSSVCTPKDKDPPELLPLFPVQPCTSESQRRR